MTGQARSSLALPRVMRRPALPALLMTLALMGLVRSAVPTLAHANLVRSDPVAGAVLPAAPKQVQLWFSEEPDPHFSEVHVLDAQRQSQDAGDMHVAPGDSLSLIVGLKPLPDGLYTISWKTVSAVDGHTVAGSVPFYVGQPPPGTVLSAASQVGPASSGSGPSFGTVTVRWLSLLSAIVLFGGFTFWPLVLQPALQTALAPRPGPGAMAAPAAAVDAFAKPARAARGRMRQILLGAWILLAAAGAVTLLQQAQSVSGAGIAGVFGGAVQTLLFHTRFGTVWWLRALATVAAGVAVFVSVRTGGRGLPRLSVQMLGAAAVEAVFLSYSLNSHAAALTSASGIATVSDLLHLTAAGLWIGGLVQFALVVPVCVKRLDSPDRVRVLAATVPRFSTVAVASVITLVVTGVYQGVRQVSGWSALWETAWGLTLDLKLLLIVPVLLLGAFNLLLVRPALSRGATNVGEQADSEADGRIGTPQRLDRKLAGAVAVESVLGALILLAVGVLVNQPPPRVAGESAAPGIHLTSSAEGTQVKLTITPGVLGQNHFEVTVSQRGKPPPDGTQVVLRLTYQDADLGTSEVQTKAEGTGHFSADSSDISTYGRWQVLALVQPPSADEVRTDFALTLTQSGANGVGSAATAKTSVSRGRQLYVSNCAECHGSDARGDGPRAKQLDPPPADLVVHAPQHGDQQLLNWIANGIPTTAMPAFGKKLNDQDRQAIVNYLRSLPKDSAVAPQPAKP